MLDINLAGAAPAWRAMKLSGKADILPVSFRMGSATAVREFSYPASFAP
jgi:hypothetical protein